MRKFVLAFLLAAQFSQAQDVEKTIAGFLETTGKREVVQYTVKIIMHDDSKGEFVNNYQCAERFDPADTLAGGYFNILEADSKCVYSGSEYYEYYPQYYGKGIVSYYDRQKHTADFTGYEVEMDGIKGYSRGVLKGHPMFDYLLISLIKKITNKNFLFADITTKDSTIGERGCIILRISGTEFYAFDSTSYLPLYYYCNKRIQSHEVFYSDYRFNETKPEQLFSRKAFPKNYKFKYQPEAVKQKSLAIGQSAPAWELLTINDVQTNSNDFLGKPVLLIFSEIGCLPCMAAIPSLNEISEKFKDVTVLAIYPLDSKEALLKLSKEKKYAYNILYKAKNVAKSYYISGYPAFFLIDGNWTLRYTDSGWSGRMKKTLENEIEKVLKQKLKRK